MSELTETRRHRSQKEEMNLLYVALTRAKQYLFISGSGKAKSERKHWYRLIKESCGEQTAFGDDPLKQTTSAPETIAETITEPSVDLKLFSDEVPVNTLTQQIEPSRAGIAQKSFLPTPASEDAQWRGIATHKALELLSQQSYDSLSSFKQAFENYSDADDEVRNACAEEAWSLMQSSELEVLFNKALYSKTHHEMPLLYEDNEGRIVYGMVDQVCVAQDQVWVIDYKTNRLPENHRERFYQQTASRYLPQMRCYKEGLAKLFPGKAIKVSILFTKSGFLYDYPSFDNSI